MMTRPEDLYPALSEAYNAGDLEAVLSLYDPKAVFVIKPGRVTEVRRNCAPPYSASLICAAA